MGYDQPDEPTTMALRRGGIAASLVRRCSARRSWSSATPLTELDGSAKGGIAVAIAHEFGLPVKVVGVGVRVDDPRPFDPEDFGCPLVYS
jgi:signal recognition particle GTPase